MTLTKKPTGNYFDFAVDFYARVENSVNANNGEVKRNGGALGVANRSNAYTHYTSLAGADTYLYFDAVDAEIKEPALSIATKFSTATQDPLVHADAGDIITVTVTASNTGSATAYNARISDNLSLIKLNYAGNVAGAGPPDSVDTAVSNQPVFIFNSIAAGTSKTFTYQVQLIGGASGVQPNESITNQLQATWTSLASTALSLTGGLGANGSATGMRDGSASPALNDYHITASSTFTVSDVAISKSITLPVTPSAVAAIGETRQFQVALSFPEGVTKNVVLTDNLASGSAGAVYHVDAASINYTFENIASPGSISAPTVSGNTVTWNIGDVVTNEEDDNAATPPAHFTPRILVTYTAYVNNDTATNAGGSLRNSASITYQNQTVVPLSSSPAAVTVVEPLINLTKSLADSTGTLTYTLRLTAATGGNYSEAFDAAITETLSAGLTYVGGSAAFTTFGGTTVGNATPSVSGQTISWSTANNIDIPAGGYVELTYQATYTVGTMSNLTSASLVQWTSLDGSGAGYGERDGSGYSVPATPYNDYYSTISVNRSPYTDYSNIFKIRNSDTYESVAPPGDDNVRVGDLIEYQLNLNMSFGTTLSAKVVDVLPQGLQFDSIISINGDTNGTDSYTQGGVFTYAAINTSAITVSGDPAAGGETVTWNLGDITNSHATTSNNDAASYFVIKYRARVINSTVLSQLASQSLANTAKFTYLKSDTSTAFPQNGKTVTLLQPVLTISKTAAVSPHTTSTVAIGDTVTYTVDINNAAGAAPAYDLVLTDVIARELQNGASTITMDSATLNGNNILGSISGLFNYNTSTNTATWDFASGTANQFAIPASGNLHLVYHVTVNNTLSAGVTVTNAVNANYCSYDSQDMPLGPTDDVNKRRCYTGSSNTSSISSAAATVLGKTALQTSAAIGEQFKYRITVPSSAMTTSLYDVRILDDLSASTADMSYVSGSITQVTGAGLVADCAPVVSGAPKNLVITCGNSGGLDIPAGQQAVFEITVVLNDSVTNRNLTPATFQNSASYTFNKIDGDNGSQTSTATASASMNLVTPVLTMQKSGPATMHIGTPGNFRLDVTNTGTGKAYDPEITDILPNPNPGGMCDSQPTIVSVQITDGTNIIRSLVQDTDYNILFSNSSPTATTCRLVLQKKSAQSNIAPNEHLVINYQASLDADNYAGVSLTNLAGATKWSTADTTPANVASGQIHTYSNTLTLANGSTPGATDGTPGTTDWQDAHTVTIDIPVLKFRKTVRNVTTGQLEGANSAASPGDRLHYTISIQNMSTFAVNNFKFTDELDRLNSVADFVPGTLTLTSIPTGASATFTTSTGGSKGTGLVDIRNISLTANVSATPGGSDTATIEFEVTLAPVITSGTTVLNQAQLPTITNPPLNSDDPYVNGADVPATIGDEDATQTHITSAPSFRVQKSSQDLTGDPNVLMAGDHLRYTITIKNIGNENASNVSLKDALPANTSYVAGSTRLNGVVVSDIGGVSPLQSGMLINAPENLTAGVMRADSGTTTSNVATVTFEVQINSNVLNGTIISNQGFVNGSGLGSGTFSEKPSDDPATATANDPTLNIVGNFPLLVVQKTVALHTDNNGNGVTDPSDVLRYTITINNLSSIPATSIQLTDAVPANTTYVTDSTFLNGNPVNQPDGGVSPLIAGIPVEAVSSAPGSIGAHQSATVVFDVTVNAGVATGTVISNQGLLTSAELPSQETDADGNSSNGYQATTIVVGTAQQILLTKQVTVVGGGAALPGGQLEYLLQATNTGSAAVTNLVLTDDLSTSPLASQVSYIANSATLNGSTSGVTVSGSVITANYAATYGSLAAGNTAQLRFRVLIASNLATGTTITNTGKMDWNAAPVLSATAAVSIDVGGIPGSATLNGHVWHDANFNNLADTGELNLSGWSVNVYRGSTLLGVVTTDANGLYVVQGLTPVVLQADRYDLKFLAPAAVATTAKLGKASSAFFNGLQEISGVSAGSGSNLQNLNLPIDPDGVVYNAILRTAATGATLTMYPAGSSTPLPSTCFDDPAQQGQVTLASGYYKFDMNFSDAACPSGGNYVIQTTSPAAFMPGQSLIIPPQTSASTAAFSVPTCPASATDAIPATTSYCEAQTSELAPGVSVAANTAGTNYYLKLALNSTQIPGHSQLFNNHIPLDPRLDNAVSITKTSPLQNVTKGQLVPYTITVSNTLAVTLSSMSVVDTFPPGFKYVAGSGRLDGQPVEPAVTTTSLTWNNLQLATNTKRTIQLMLIVGAGVKEGKYVNRAQVFNTITSGAGSPVATATVRVIPDPTLDCSDVIGKVFDDNNLNGYQDEGEKGLPGIRLATARGLIVTTDKQGRFHITCAVVPDPDRGSNYIIKLDDRSLPSGYRITTENPRVQRATRGKMLKFNFAAAIHKVVKMDMADAVFEPGTPDMRMQWVQRLDLLLKELQKAPSVLRLTYLAETEDESLVNARLKAVKTEIASRWKKLPGKYDLTIETETFWSRGGPPEKTSVTQ